VEVHEARDRREGGTNWVEKQDAREIGSGRVVERSAKQAARRARLMYRPAIGGSDRNGKGSSVAPPAAVDR
jgi:hypothetical protein